MFQGPLIWDCFFVVEDLCCPLLAFIIYSVVTYMISSLSRLYAGVLCMCELCFTATMLVSCSIWPIASAIFRAAIALVYFFSWHIVVVTLLLVPFIMSEFLVLCVLHNKPSSLLLPVIIRCLAELCSLHGSVYTLLSFICSTCVFL